MPSLWNTIANQPPSYEKKKKYKFGRVLGQGTYGEVKEATLIETSEPIAIKIIPKKNVKGAEKMVHEEMELLARLNHPHIVRFVDWFESKDKFYIVTQLATGGELFDRICDIGKFTEKDAVNVVKECLDAVSYLHGQHIVHRDLKPENLLYLTREKESPLVLADFGIAKTLDESKQELLTSMAGSLGYAAPEVLTRKGHSYSCDMWSMGVITYTLLCGYSPFRADDKDELIEECSKANVQFHERYWKDVSIDAKTFIKSLLQPDPKKRPSAKEALADKWLTGETAKNVDILPNIREGFNARSIFKAKIQQLLLTNRLATLKTEEDDSSDGENTQDIFRQIVNAASDMAANATGKTSTEKK